MQNENLNALQVGEILPTKANAAIIGAEIVRKCQEGEADTLQTIARLSGIKAAIDTAMEGLKQQALAEVAKHGKAGASVLSAKIESIEAGVKYDYSGCPVWRELNATVEAATEDRKERERFLRGLSKPLTEIDEATGEARTINPPVKRSTTTIKVTLADTGTSLLTIHDPAVSAVIIDKA